jgi:WD40 repeat protein
MSAPKIIPHRSVVTSFSSASNIAADSTAYEEGHYVLHVACGPCPNSTTSTSAPKAPLTCALSNQCVQTYDRATLKKCHTINQAHRAPITDLAHSQIASSGDAIHSPLLVTSSQDGLVKIFDLRVNSSSSPVPHVMQLDLAKSKEEALSVSVGYNGTLAAVSGSKGNIHFFDLRNTASSTSNGSSDPLGSYVDSHTDEVTKVRFQRLDRDSHNTTSLLVSASEDGLACIFDTSQPSEELALRSVMNVGSPLRDVGFFGPSFEGLYCLTGSETMSAWHHDSAQKICDFGDVRNQLSSSSGIPIHYLVGCSWDRDELNLVAGNTDGECAIFKVDTGSISVKKILSGGHKGCVRSFVPCTWNNSIITGGEDSRLCEWHVDQVSVNSGTNGRDAASSYILSSEKTTPRSGGGVIRRQKKKKGYSPY